MLRALQDWLVFEKPTDPGRQPWSAWFFMEELAKHAHMGLSTVRQALSWASKSHRYADGTFSCPMIRWIRRKGGLTSNGTGIPSVLVVDPEAVAAWRGVECMAKPPESGGFKVPESGDEAARIQQRSRQIPDSKPPESGDNHTPSSDPKEKIPTTTTREIGGDGGGGTFEEGDDEEADADEVVRILTEYGVTSSKAHELATVVAPEVVGVGIRWMEQNARSAKSPAGLLVKILTDGTAIGEHQREVEAKAVRKRAELVRRRCQAYHALFDRILELAENLSEGDKSMVVQKVRALRQRWPNAEDLANEEMLSDEELFSDRTRHWDLYNKLMRAAKARMSSGAENKVDFHPNESERTSGDV